MSMYDAQLPMAFTHVVVIQESQLAPLVAKLLSPDRQHTNGSSFAVTADATTGMRKLWLSHCSAKRLNFASEAFLAERTPTRG